MKQRLQHFVYGKFTTQGAADYHICMWDELQDHDHYSEAAKHLNNLLGSLRMCKELNALQRAMITFKGEWIYLKFFPSQPGDRDGRAVRRYHAVILAEEDTCRLKWAPWALDHLLVESFVSDSLTIDGSAANIDPKSYNPTRHVIWADLEAEAARSVSDPAVASLAELARRQLARIEARKLPVEMYLGTSPGVIGRLPRECLYSDERGEVHINEINARTSAVGTNQQVVREIVEPRLEAWRRPDTTTVPAAPDSERTQLEHARRQEEMETELTRQQLELKALRASVDRVAKGSGTLGGGWRSQIVSVPFAVALVCLILVLIGLSSVGELDHNFTSLNARFEDSEHVRSNTPVVSNDDQHELRQQIQSLQQNLGSLQSLYEDLNRSFHTLSKQYQDLSSKTNQLQIEVAKLKGAATGQTTLKQNSKADGAKKSKKGKDVTPLSVPEDQAPQDPKPNGQLSPRLLAPSEQQSRR